MRTQGTLIKWNEDRGFGFAKTRDSGIEVFAHISEFPRGGRRPQSGDALAFEITTREDGRKQAKRITFDTPRADTGLTLAPTHRTTKPRAARTSTGQYPRHHRHEHHSSSGRTLSSVIALTLLIGLGVLGYRKYQAIDASAGLAETASQQTGNSPVRSHISATVTSAFRCDGRQHCSQMRSCAEATWFIGHCPNTKMDGDHDGVPCEQQLCN